MDETPQEPSSDVPVPQADLGWMQSMFEANRLMYPRIVSTDLNDLTCKI
jgi:hypothetical protein